MERQTLEATQELSRLNYELCALRLAERHAGERAGILGGCCRHGANQPPLTERTQPLRPAARASDAPGHAYNGIVARPAAVRGSYQGHRDGHAGPGSVCEPRVGIVDGCDGRRAPAHAGAICRPRKVLRGASVGRAVSGRPCCAAHAPRGNSFGYLSRPCMRRLRRRSIGAPWIRWRTACGSGHTSRRHCRGFGRPVSRRCNRSLRVCFYRIRSPRPAPRRPAVANEAARTRGHEGPFTRERRASRPSARRTRVHRSSHAHRAAAHNGLSRPPAGRRRGSPQCRTHSRRAGS